MTKEDAQAMLDLLCGAFNIPQIRQPLLRWHRGVVRGTYRASFTWRKGLLTKRITLGPRCWRGVENSMLHEFAHFLEYYRHPVSGKSHHGPAFIEELRNVTEAWHNGDSSRYDWSTEYRRVAAAGPTPRDTGGKRT